jgi:hypothetical protein
MLAICLIRYTEVKHVQDLVNTKASLGVSIYKNMKTHMEKQCQKREKKMLYKHFNMLSSGPAMKTALLTISGLLDRLIGKTKNKKVLNVNTTAEAHL